MDISTALQFLLLPAGALAIAGVSRRQGWSAPLLLVVAGLVASFVPGMPAYELDPEIVLSVFLPPMLYSAALDSSYLRLRDVKQVVGLLAVGLVLFNTVAIGLVAHMLIPGLPLAAAFALGAIVAPTDAVSAIAVGRKLGLPRKSITILVGEGLFNDATALTAYRVAVAAAVAGTTADLLGAGGEFLYSAGTGIVVGLVIAYAVGVLLRRLSDSLIANGISLLVPYGAYVAAEAAHASGVISVVIAGIYLGHEMSRTSYGTRILSGAVWKVADLVLESIVFALIGLQVRPIVMGLAEKDFARVGIYAGVLFLLAVVLRALWVPLTVYAPMLFRRMRERTGVPAWRNVTLTSWAGMRGVVSLAAAFALPKDFPQRDLLLFLTFAVVIGTLIVQGLSFPWLIRRLGVSNDAERYSDDLSEAAAQQAAAAAALARLDELIADGVLDVHEEVVEQLRSRAERTALRAWERLGGGTGLEGAETPSTLYRRMRREMIAAQREVFVRLRDERRIDDEVLHRVMQELDFEEATLERN
ncbi:Na+/H+ antiporter [Planotetraspora phitsanulokensis]|uniref:Na+/H+ antiporter n=1 Tax=Planotetraspora phitsanulokensis TaxID=575192 RepID=A0A8J3XEF9_9ACTN|nr:Na+/H+ antiporter [Planotetraspora phitsanulokensis]GII38452.1 Na+/H+ antiporter [Planotetraspora phitsanulokensis]